jgi:hypothetical protein
MGKLSQNVASTLDPVVVRYPCPSLMLSGAVMKRRKK